MQKILLLALWVAISGSAMADTKIQKRCGWLINPTPANLLLMDASGSLWISKQGSGDSIPESDWDNLPATSKRESVQMDSGYGYSCTCLNVRLNDKKDQIVRIYGGKSLPLKQCLADKKLPKP